VCLVCSGAWHFHFRPNPAGQPEPRHKRTIVLRDRGRQRYYPSGPSCLCSKPSRHPFEARGIAPTMLKSLHRAKPRFLKLERITVSRAPSVASRRAAAEARNSDSVLSMFSRGVHALADATRVRDVCYSLSAPGLHVRAPRSSAPASSSHLLAEPRHDRGRPLVSIWSPRTNFLVLQVQNRTMRWPPMSFERCLGAEVRCENRPSNTRSSPAPTLA